MPKVIKVLCSVILVFALAVIMFVLDSHNLKTNPAITQIFFSLGMILVGAIITGNILGNMRGQIGKKITFTFWKGIAVAKSYSFPTGEFTDPQLVRQGKFADAIEFARLLLTQVIQVVWNMKAVQMSGFNLFVRKLILGNQSLLSPNGAYIFWGDLTPKEMDSTTYNPTTGNVTLTWNPSNEGNQKSTDLLRVVIYKSSTRDFDCFMQSSVLRSTGTAVLNINTGLAATDVFVAASFVSDFGLSTVKYQDAALTPSDEV